jgi:hypothetical protein
MKQHEGKFSASVDGFYCEFDGNAWLTPDGDLTGRLNDATSSTPKTHVGIRELAELVLRKAGLWEGARIIAVQQVDRINDLPPDVIS